MAWCMCEWCICIQLAVPLCRQLRGRLILSMLIISGAMVERVTGCAAVLPVPIAGHHTTNAGMHPQVSQGNACRRFALSAYSFSLSGAWTFMLPSRITSSSKLCCNPGKAVQICSPSLQDPAFYSKQQAFRTAVIRLIILQGCDRRLLLAGWLLALLLLLALQLRLPPVSCHVLYSVHSPENSMCSKVRPYK